MFFNYESNYSAAIDMWSLGCILAEFFNKNVFLKAETPESYIEFLYELLGFPEEHTVLQINNLSLIKFMKKGSNHWKRRSLRELIPSAPDIALDLIS